MQNAKLKIQKGAALWLFAFGLLNCALLLGGCATRPVERSSVLRVESRAVIAPGPVVHVGFADGRGAWVTDNAWTNDWNFSAVVSGDLTLPLEQWQPVQPALEMYHGLLSFALPVAGPQWFCRAVYQAK